MFEISRRTILAFGALAMLASPALAEGAPWHIGFVSATSGPLKETGDSTAVAIKLAVDEINARGGVEGRKLDFIQYDTASDPRQASVGVRTLAEDKKVLAIVGPLSSAETAVAMNDAERLKILMLPYSSSAPGLTDGKKFTWRLSATEDQQFNRLLTSMKRKGIATKTADIIYVSDDRIANVTGTKVYLPLLTKAGIKVVRSVSMNINSFDVSAQVAQIMQDKPDIVAVAANYSQAVTALRELRRQHFAGRVIGSQLFSDPNLVKLFGKDANGLLFVSGFWFDKNDETRAFAARFAKAMVAAGYPERSPHHVDAQAFDTVYLLKAAIERSHVTGDPAKLAEERIALRDALKGIAFSGVLGSNICFNGGDAELPGYIIEIKNAQWTLFDEFPPNACHTAG
ncbi:MAG TPA: ABC transporter substrate-binding protein [Hyphomicrobiales bacterium]|nr:ABC transporter substrate-binding protein [Hyphomicrobiales bacterium]